jgi:ubiquinone/menaquinone biosynthesis C-methylase UbiE
MASRVDYRTAATVYEQGRALAAGDLEHWRRAVHAIVPSDFGTVLDLGAGTGIFARAWSDWGARHVIACEPSASMRKVALDYRAARTISMVAGRAEQIPLMAGTVDLVWLSTVLHHIDDLAAWAVDTRRVLKAGGWLLIRNLFADLGHMGWMAEIPGAERVRRWFPTVTSVAGMLAAAGLELVDTAEVPESNPNWTTARGAAAWVRMMRSADSVLLAFNDEEIEVALHRLESYPDDHVLRQLGGGLAVFRVT